MKNISLFLLVIFGLIILNSCSLHIGYVKFEKKADEILPTQAIKKYMKEHSKPSIVIKAPNIVSNATQSDPNDYIYNAIEKELFIAGFDVKDRGLFNEVMKKSDNINYKEIKKITGTDLILELVVIDTKVKYTTNRFYSKKGIEKIIKDNELYAYGATIEFKIILIENNEYAGSYSFYYTPCVGENNGCECEIAYKNYHPIKIYPHLSFCNKNKKRPGTEAYEYVTKNAMEEFVRGGVKKMIKEIR